MFSSRRHCSRCNSPRRPSSRRLSSQQQSAFTLVELLVVIAIIGILVALLLPAVQAAREAARRSQCTSQLKQLGLAVQSHHDQVGVFPAGRTSTQQFGISWAFQLLPFIEESSVHDAFVVGQRVDDDLNTSAMRTPVPVFVCPSRRQAIADRDFDNDDNPSLAPGVAAPSDYAANAGRRLLVGIDPDSGDTRLIARRVDRAEAGPMFTYSQVKARQVTDGLSHTLAVGEKHRPNPPAGADENMRHYWQGDTAAFAGDNPNTAFRVSTPGLRSDSQADDGEREAFGGPHPSVTLFTYLDGHVQPLKNDIPIETLHRLASVGDGEVIDQSDL